MPRGACISAVVLGKQQNRSLLLVLLETFLPSIHISNRRAAKAMT